jgi:hypothetical protein
MHKKTVFVLMVLIGTLGHADGFKKLKELESSLAQMEKKVAKLNVDGGSNAINNHNRTINAILKKDIPKFSYNKKKEAVIYVRESYSKIDEGRYIVLNKADFVRVLINKKNKWDY